MTANEFSRQVRLDTIGTQPRTLALEADPAERSALAVRFGLLAVDALTADLQLAAVEGGIRLWGPMQAFVTQACVATGAPVPAEIADGVDILFRPAPDPDRPDEEIELDETELDVMFHDGAAIDAGEAVAQSLMLALDPYPRAPEAEAALREAGVKSEEEAGPFAALAGLRDKLKR